MTQGKQPRAAWTLAITGAALFMTALDNLVVGVALPSILEDLGGSLESLEWTVNAYTLAFAVLLLTGAALGDRFGRRRMFTIGVGIFTAASAAAALAPTIDALIAARAIQGIGAAIVTPLTLTLVSEAFPPDRRGAALGVWGGISGLGVALGPFVGGAIVEGIAWQWIFVLNVPVGLALLPLASRLLTESRGPDTTLDLGGLLLGGLGLFGITFGIIRGETLGWTSATVVSSLALGAALLAVFIAYERRHSEPMLRLRMFSSRAFSATQALSFAMFFGTFGSIFLLSQFFQIAQGYGAFEAGARTLPWTLMPMFVAPLAGALSDRVGTKPLMTLGIGMQAIGLGWLALVIDPQISLMALIAPFMIAGSGMALVFPTAAATVLAAVKPEEAGKASGSNNAIREVGGVMGVAVLASVFAAHGGFESPQAFSDGVAAALPIGTAVLAAGFLLSLLVPGRGTRPGSSSTAEAPVQPSALQGDTA